MLRSFLLAFVVSVFLLLLFPLPSRAQPTRMLEEFQFGQDSMVARVLFIRGEGKELCVALGTHKGPRSINKGSLFITRRVRPKEKGYSGRVKFKFAKKPDDTSHETLNIWHACVDTAGPAPEGAKEDVLEVTVRGGQENGLHSRFYADYPAEDMGYAIDIHHNSVGGLAGGSYEINIDPKNPLNLSWSHSEAPAQEETAEEPSPGDE